MPLNIATSFSSIVPFPRTGTLNRRFPFLLTISTSIFTTVAADLYSLLLYTFLSYHSVTVQGKYRSARPSPVNDIKQSIYSENRHYDLHKNNKQNHCYRIDCCIGNSWNIAVGHGIRRRQSWGTCHATGNCSHEIKHVYLENK